jgi:4-aminobutyrate aminotransferase-like enzyme
LNELKEKYSIIGDVRGFGLFLGIELVRDPESLEPADKEADQIVNSMKEKGILISTDGPDHNVLKIKPPLVFTKDNAIQLVETLNGVLNEADY